MHWVAATAPYVQGTTDNGRCTKDQVELTTSNPLMRRRVLTAVILIPPVVYLIGWAPEWLFLLALVVTVEIGLYEYFVISRSAGFKAFPAIGYVAAPVVCVAQAFELRGPGSWGYVVLILVILFTLTVALIVKGDLKHYLGATASTLFGILYVALNLSWLVPLRFSNPSVGRNLMLLLFLVIWAGDIGALFVGRSMGRILLVPKISPKKTLEGAIGGFAASLLVAWGFARWFWQEGDMKTVMSLAAFVALAGQIGDLVESALKRGAELKDSGGILPGHGGLLDRIDSLIFGAPALWLGLTLKNLWLS